MAEEQSDNFEHFACLHVSALRGIPKPHRYTRPFQIFTTFHLSVRPTSKCRSTATVLPPLPFYKFTAREVYGWRSGQDSISTQRWCCWLGVLPSRLSSEEAKALAKLQGDQTIPHP
jgi:hypothetical protein